MFSACVCGQIWLVHLISTANKPPIGWSAQPPDLLVNISPKLYDGKLSIDKQCWEHYCDVIMGTMASQVTSFTIVSSTVYSGADQRKHQSSASLAFVRGIHRWPVKSSHKRPVTRKMFSFDNVFMNIGVALCVMVSTDSKNDCILYTVYSINYKHYSVVPCCVVVLSSVLSSSWVDAIRIWSPWASYQIRKIVFCACAGNVGNVFPATDYIGNR